MNSNFIETVRYRVAHEQNASSIVSRIAGLGKIESHHDWLLDHGDLEAMRNARDQWLNEIVELGVTPAGDLSEAVEKVGTLSRSMRSRLIDMAIHDGEADDLAGTLAVITYAATAEAERWALPEPRFMPVDPAHAEAEHIPTPCQPATRDLERYACARERRTFEWAERRVAALEKHVAALREAGEVGSVEDARSELRLAVCKAVTVPAHSLAQLEAKHAVLTRQEALIEPAWLVDPMVGGILLVEYRSLQVSPADKKRLGDMLPKGEH